MTPVLPGARALRGAALVLACAAASLGAQTLPEVVVTATRGERAIDEMLVDVRVIDAAEIARSGAASLVELLRARAGVEISQNGGPAALSGLFVRGTKTAQTAVLVDGVRLENPTGGGANLEYLPLAAIERIEIVRGPASALYGSAAMGGVIQIFTRGGSGRSTSAQVALGTQGSAQWQAALSRSDAEGRTRFNASVSGERSDGFDATRPGSANAQADRDGYHRLAASAGLVHRLDGGWQIAASAMGTEGRAAYDDAFSTPATARLSYRTTALSLAARGRLSERWSTELRVGQTGIDYRYLAFDFAPSTESRSLQWLNALLLPAGRLEFGVEHLDQQISGSGVNAGTGGYLRTQRSTVAAYVAGEVAVGDHRLRLQARNDRIDGYGSESTAALGWGWSFAPAWRVRASWATSFRAPTFDDLFSPYGANPALRAERGEGGEVALEHRGSGDAMMRLIAFDNRIRDAIELDATFVPRNLARARVQGLTAEARRTWAGLSWRGSLTAQDAIGERDDGTPAQRLARRARVHGVLGADWQRGPWRAGAQLIGQGDRVDTRGQALPGYGVVDLIAGWRFAPSWELFARAANLGDRVYETAAGYAMPGRTLWIGLRFSERAP
jgi:vitamin B12 transporter